MSELTTASRLFEFLRNEPHEGLDLERLSGFGDYELQRIADFSNKFDDIGDITLLVLAALCRRQIEDTVIPMKLVLESTKDVEPYRECQNILQSEEVAKCRQAVVDNLARIIAAVSSPTPIGGAEDIDKVLDGAVLALVPGFRQLKYEVYLRSGQPVGKITGFSPTVQVCGSLAELLVRLEKSPDGIYVGFVAIPGTLDGWFGIFCKSNGNMFSYNERIDEAYRGQHGNMRNGRYAEDKAYDLFPYELCQFSDDCDYKGYSRSMDIGDKRRLIDAPDFSVIARTVLAMALVARKHEGHDIDGEPVVIDSLMPRNLAALKDADVKSEALVKWESSALVEASSRFQPPAFEVGKFLRGGYDAEYCHGKDGYKPHRGWFYGVNQDMVDAYGCGFRLDHDRILISNSSRRLIGDAGTEQEVIGPPAKLRLLAYYEARKQLAGYVEKQLRAEFEEFGGMEALKSWYRDQLIGRLETVYAFCVDAYSRLAPDKEYVSLGGPTGPEHPTGSSFDHGDHPACVRIGPKPCYSWTYLNEHDSRFRAFSCPVTKAKASVFFKFQFYNYRQVEELLGLKPPKFCVGWHESFQYNGNSILDVVDPVGEIVHPLHNKYPFEFLVGFSKGGLNKLKGGKNGAA